MKIYPVIMCGGAGTRLWPASTRRQPKQFHRLITENTVFQDTILRLQNVSSVEIHERPLVISNAAYSDLIHEQLKEIGVEPLALLLEPEGKNTAAVAAIAAEFVYQTDPDGLALLLPSDHHVSAPQGFHEALERAASASAEGNIAIFGITPDRPETGFGYIQAGEEIRQSIHRVAAFREKPDLPTAERFLSEGGFSWNAGIFLFPPELMLRELETFAPGVLTPSRAALSAARCEGVNLFLDPAHFKSVESISIDYAVMEHTDHAVLCAPVSCGWSDIGIWPVVGELQNRQPDVEPIFINSENCIVHTEGDTLVAVVGVSDLIVVSVDNSVLVVPKSEAQNVGKIVAEIRKRGLNDKA